MEAPFLPPVSVGLFWCLVFAVCPGDVPNMLNTVERHIACLEQIYFALLDYEIPWPRFRDA